MKGITIQYIVELIAVMITGYILFTIMIMFFNATPQVGYDTDIVPVNDQRHYDVCFDTMNRFIDSCILNDTVILREEGHFEKRQISKYSCGYNLLYKTGFNMSINCSAMGKLCYIDKTEKYDIGKCK